MERDYEKKMAQKMAAPGMPFLGFVLRCMPISGAKRAREICELSTKVSNRMRPESGFKQDSSNLRGSSKPPPC